jgi:hypothetical protein
LNVLIVTPGVKKLLQQHPMEISNYLQELLMVSNAAGVAAIIVLLSKINTVHLIDQAQRTTETVVVAVEIPKDMSTTVQTALSTHSLLMADKMSRK